MSVRRPLLIALLAIALPAAAPAGGQAADLRLWAPAVTLSPNRFPALERLQEPPPAPSTPPVAPPPAAPAPAPAEPEPEPEPPKGKCITDAAFASARRYARIRPGHVSIAVFEHGIVRSAQGSEAYRSASIVKAMLLAADLRRHARLGVGLSKGARSRLASMIRTSSNTAASATFELVGREGLLQVARAVGMRNYTVAGYWGTSRVTAADQARLFGRLHSVLPAAHRTFARRLLSTIVPSQTWGGARVARRAGYHVLFKAGWLPRTDGWVVHQGLRLERGGCSVGVAVLTGRQPNMSAGVTSIRGVVDRLLPAQA